MPCACSRACKKHDPRVTSQTATPLQLVFQKEKQPGRSSHDAKFLHLHAGESSPAGPGRGGGWTRCGRWGKRVRSSSLVLAARPRGLVRASSRHGRLPLFLLPAASFLDGIAVHVSLAAADWLDVRDQHKVTVVKRDSTENHFRSRGELFPPFF